MYVCVLGFATYLVPKVRLGLRVRMVRVRMVRVRVRMVRVRLGCWVMAIDRTPHNDRNMRMCVCVCEGV